MGFFSTHFVQSHLKEPPHAYMERESFVFFSLLDPIYGVYNVLLMVTKVVETLDDALKE